MTGATYYSYINLLNYLTGFAAMPSTPTPYVALLTAVGSDAGTGFTEVSGNGYTRSNSLGAWSAASGSGPSTISNSTGINFPTATGAWTGIVAFGIFDALTSGNLLFWDWIGNDPWFPFNCTLASPGVFTAPGITAGSTPTLVNTAKVVFTAQYGGGFPAGITQSTQYTVSGLSSDSFNVSTNTTSVGSGFVRQVTPVTISNGQTARFNMSNLTLTAT